MGHSRAGNYHANSPNCAKIKLVQDFMYVPVMLSASLIKMRSKMKSRSSGQHFPKSMRPSREGNSHVNSRKWAKIELVRDFMHTLIICKFDEDSIKNEVTIVLPTFSHICLWEAKGQVILMWTVRFAPKSNTTRFYGCPHYLQVWWKFYQNEIAIIRTTFA